MTADEFVVVDADHGDLLRHADIGGFADVKDGHRQFVIGGHHGRWLRQRRQPAPEVCRTILKDMGPDALCRERVDKPRQPFVRPDNAFVGWDESETVELAAGGQMPYGKFADGEIVVVDCNRRSGPSGEGMVLAEGGAADDGKGNWRRDKLGNQVLPMCVGDDDAVQPVGFSTMKRVGGKGRGVLDDLDFPSVAKVEVFQHPR